MKSPDWIEKWEALDKTPVGSGTWGEKYEEWERAFHAWARETIKTAYPNPERRGCPPISASWTSLTSSMKDEASIRRQSEAFLQDG